MFRIQMLDADHGDCLLIEYGLTDCPKRILIDAGTPATYKRSLLPKIEEIINDEGVCEFELFVVTHIDADHIGGALDLLRDANAAKVKIKQIWFNCFAHLTNQDPYSLGVDQAEDLTEFIIESGLSWNESFRRLAVMVPDEGRLPEHVFEGMKLTLARLINSWRAAILEAGLRGGMGASPGQDSEDNEALGDDDDIEFLAEGEFDQDSTAPNGSSIAFLAEFDGVKVLFGADAHPSVLLSSAMRVPLNGEIQKLTAFKLPHHGSRKNVSNELLEMFPADHYLISTNGSRFHHPDSEAIARVVVRKSRKRKFLYFNVGSDANEVWGRPNRQDSFRYLASFGEAARGLTVDLKK
jgi:beta-lactamase superfamily II metal-dependent hydrolase